MITSTRRRKMRLNSYRSKYPELFTTEFDEFCKNEIFPLYEGKIVKKATKEEENKILFQVGAVFVGMLLTLIVTCLLKELYSPFHAIVFFVLVLVIFIVFFGKSSSSPDPLAKEKIKEKVYPKIMLYIGNCERLSIDDPNYDLYPHLSSLSILNKMPKYYSDFYDDRFVIDYNGLNVDMCELRFGTYGQYINKRPIRMGGGNAAFFRVKLNCDTFGKVVITRKMFDGKNLFDFVKKIRFENKEFLKFYDISFTNEQEANMLLSDELINKLVQYAKENKFCDLNLSIENGCINLIYCSGLFANMFEIPRWISEDVKSTADEFRKIIIEILECISVLDYIKIDKIAGY